MMRADALNFYGYLVGTEMTVTKHIMTSHICSVDESELKEFPVDKLYCRSIQQKRTNQKESSSKNVERRKTNKNAFTKI